MTESDARNALRELGISPTRQLIEDWQRAACAEVALTGQPTLVDRVERLAWSSQPQAARARTRETPSSKSRLEPLLRETGALNRTPGRRRPGRPRIVASWFEAVAVSMADGTSLGMALAINGITNLSKSEIRACYRNRTFQALYREARRVFLAEHYGRKPTLRAKVGRYL